MSPFFPIAEGFAVAPRPLLAADMADAAAAGYAVVVSNLPDEEAGAGGAAAALADAAKAAGVGFIHIPVSMREITGSALALPHARIDEMAGALEQGGTVAFCQAGTRSVLMWALAQAKTKRAAPEAIIAMAAAAGLDLSPLAGTLKALADA